MSKISKFPVELIIEHKPHHDVKEKCMELNIKRRALSKFCKKSLLNKPYRFEELAQTKKSHLLSVFEHILERFSIFQIEDFLNILYHREHQTPNQAISKIRQNINKQKRVIKCKKHEIKNLKLLIRGQKKKQIGYFLKTLKEFCLKKKQCKLNVQSTSIQERINQKLCQLLEELDFDIMKPAFKTVPYCSNDNTKGLLQVKEYYPSIQSIGLNHVGKTLVWHIASSKFNCEQDVGYYNFNSLNNFFEEQQLASVLSKNEANLDLEVIEEQEIDSSNFKIDKEDCKQLNQKGAAFQVEKARSKAMRAMKKKPDEWKCLLNACKTQKWEVNWIDKDEKK